MQNLTAAEQATMLEALKLLRSVALAGEVRPVQLTSCYNAAEVVTNALAGLPDELVEAHTKNLWVFRTGPEGSNWQEVRLRKLAQTEEHALRERAITSAIALVQTMASSLTG